MSEYVYRSHGEPLANDSGEIALAREEIVRCGDCKYHQHNSYHRCDLYTISHEVEPDGFCSWGERKEVD